MKFTLGTACLLILSAVACKKDSNGKSALDGNWTFTSMGLKGTSTTVTDDGNGTISKTVTTSDYTSTDNKGTVSISGGVMTSKGMSYSVSTTSPYIRYVNGVQQDAGTLPFAFTMPPFNSVAGFKVVGADSIVFTGGASSFGGSSNAGGAKYNISGNTLTMMVKLDTTFVDNRLGFPVQKHDVATQTTILTRQ